MKLFNATNIRNQTAIARGDTPAPSPKTFSERAIAVAAVVDKSSFGCQQQNVRELVAAIIGEELPPTGKVGDEATFIVGSVIIFKGEAVLVRSLDSDGDARFFTTEGNHETSEDSYIDCDCPDDFRVADTVEVEAFLLAMGLVESEA